MRAGEELNALPAAIHDAWLTAEPPVWEKPLCEPWESWQKRQLGGTAKQQAL